MGNLMGSLRYKEPSTIEECDSTWETDSESDEHQGEEDSGISESISPSESGKCAELPDASQQVVAAVRLHGSWYFQIRQRIDK